MGGKSLEKTKPKPRHRKGLWSPEEDQRLINYIVQHGHGCWTSVPINAGLQRNGKSCRLRWINYLRPGLKRGMFTAEEEEAILTLHRSLGNKWSQIAQHLPGRTDNEIKNFWHSYLKKKVAKAEEIESIPKTQFTANSNTQEDHIELSPAKSVTTISGFDSFEKGEGFLMDLDQSAGNYQSYLPKLFFAEWLTLDNMNNGVNNNIQANQFSCYNSENIDLTYDLDLQESFTHGGTTYNEGSCSSSELYNGVPNDAFDTQLKFEDQTPENGFGDLLPGDEITNNFFMTNNIMYI